MEMSKLAPAFAKLAEAAQEISEIFAAAGGVTLGKRGPGALLLDADGKPIKKKKEKRAPRAPTKFNEFMRTKVAQVKSDNPTMSPKDIFAMCAAMWAAAPENPKNRNMAPPPNRKRAAPAASHAGTMMSEARSRPRVRREPDAEATSVKREQSPEPSEATAQFAAGAPITPGQDTRVRRSPSA